MAPPAAGAAPLLAEGPRLRLFHDGREAGTMLLGRNAQEVRDLARRHGAS
ncbi:hypothetical protein ACIG0B_10340 [Streptomyces althioticus]